MTDVSPVLRVSLQPSQDPVVEKGVLDGGGVLTPAEHAEALIWTSPQGAKELESMLEQHSQIRWVQLPWAGVEVFADAGLFSDGRIWTSAKNLYSRPVAEHALALSLAIVHRIPRYARASEWSGQYRHLIDGRRIGVIGAGGIGAAIAQLHSPFKCQVTAITRDGSCPEWADDAFPFDGRVDAAKACDIVYLALPLVHESVAFVDGEFLEALGPSGYLVNVARGKHVDHEALAQALRIRMIAGAALDVTDPEPLPPGHPLWTMDGCLISPHTAIPEAVAMELLRARIAENLTRYRAGHPLLGRVDPMKGY